MQDTLSQDGYKMCTWQLSFEGRVLGTETVRKRALQSTICEVFDPTRLAFIEQLQQAQQAGDLEFAWVARLLPAQVLSQDAGTWVPPTHSQLAHVVGIGSFTGVGGEKAAQLLGVSAQHFRKYTASSTAKSHVQIPFATWHFLLQRLNVQSFTAGHTAPQASPHAQHAMTVTSATLRNTLELVGEVSQYLKRMPPVPVTKQFIARLDEHVGSAETLAARNLAEQIEQENNVRKQTREAFSYTAAGLQVIKVGVQGDKVKLQFAVDRIEDYDEPFRKIFKREVLMQLYRGIELSLTLPAAGITNEKLIPQE